MAVVGESAGGNLACAVSMMARDKKVALPKYQVLVYPIAGYDMKHALLPGQYPNRAPQ